MIYRDIKVLIVDDHALINEGIKQILELEDDITVVGQAANGLEAIEKVYETNPDIILLDINMPHMNGIDTLRRFKDLGIKNKVIILTIHDDREYILETLKLGADGYMLKDSDSKTFVKAIRRVASGKKYIQQSIEDIVTSSCEGDVLKEDTIRKIDSLTKREYEITILIADGLNNKAIADKLFISEKTVKNHVSNILKKLQVEDRVQAAIFAYKNNMKKI